MWDSDSIVNWATRNTNSTQQEQMAHKGDKHITDYVL
jgi:hypothetical protein